MAVQNTDLTNIAVNDKINYKGSSYTITAVNSKTTVGGGIYTASITINNVGTTTFTVSTKDTTLQSIEATTAVRTWKQTVNA